MCYNYVLGDDNVKKANMSDYEIRRPSHVNDIANIVNKLLFLHAKVSFYFYRNLSFKITLLSRSEDPDKSFNFYRMLPKLQEECINGVAMNQ